MTDNIRVNNKTMELVTDKSHDLSKYIAAKWQELVDVLPDDDDLSSSACMQMLVQGIVVLMSTYSAATEHDDYLEGLIMQLRDVHKQLHKTVRDRVRLNILESLKNDP